MSVLSAVVPFASQRFPKLASRMLASSGYTLDLDRFGNDAFTVWDERTSKRQQRAWKPLVASARAGEPRDDIAALEDALADFELAGESILEVGCGGGHLSELITYWLPQTRYTGIDLSDAMIALASIEYPGRDFRRGSAYELPADDAAFEVIVDGVALLHMTEWQRAIGEYARCARTGVILHGLTITESAPTTRFAKYAYGQPSVELVFDRAELLAVCDRAGLRVVSSRESLDYDLEPYIGIASVSETWVLMLNRKG
jgi:SAM-dependent methyltransferase